MFTLFLYIIGRFYTYPSRLHRWQSSNVMNDLVPVKQPWRKRMNKSLESTKNSWYNAKQENTAKLGASFTGHVVHARSIHQSGFSSTLSSHYSILCNSNGLIHYSYPLTCNGLIMLCNYLERMIRCYHDKYLNCHQLFDFQSFNVLGLYSNKYFNSTGTTKYDISYHYLAFIRAEEAISLSWAVDNVHRYRVEANDDYMYSAWNLSNASSKSQHFNIYVSNCIWHCIYVQ